MKLYKKRSLIPPRTIDFDLVRCPYHGDVLGIKGSRPLPCRACLIGLPRKKMILDGHGER